MMFLTIRLIFWSIALIISFLLIKKSHIIHKRRWLIIAFVAAIILTTLSALVPIENAFMTFSSLESAYQYTHSGDIQLIIHGETTDFVIGKKGDTDVYLIVPKTEEGWKVGMGLDTKRVSQTISNEIIVYVYQYKNSEDYYITILDSNGGSSKITDVYNSEFFYLDKMNTALGKTFRTYYAYINDLKDDYTITVNGNQIKLQN